MKRLLILSAAFSVSSIFAQSTKPPTKKEVVDVNKKPEAPGNTIPEGGALVVKTPDQVYAPGGCGFRKAMGGLIKVYEICFFGKNMKASDWATASDAPMGSKSFKLKLNFLRGVGGKKVSAAFSEGLSKTPAVQKLEEMDRQKFLAWAAQLNIEKESVMEFTFNEDKKMKVAFFEKAGAGTQPVMYSSDQQGLAKATAAIWYGEKPLNEDLKKDLLK